jgi:hypothetical protein
MSFLDNVVDQKTPLRDHVTVAGVDGWGFPLTVVDERWWLNIKINGTQAILYDLQASDPRSKNVADAHPDVVKSLFSKAIEDAHGGIPEHVMQIGSAPTPSVHGRDWETREVAVNIWSRAGV